MEYQEKERLVRRISSGILFAFVDFDFGPCKAVFTDPTIELDAEADFLYQYEYDSAIKMGIPTLEESFEILKDRGKWTTVDQSILENLEKDKEGLKNKLTTLNLHKVAMRDTKAKITEIDAKIEKLHKQKYALWGSTAEYISEQAKRRFLIEKIVKIDHPLFNWNQRNTAVLSVYYYEKASLKDAVIREIARSNPWRVQWTLSKETGTPLFARPATELTDLQKRLVSWSMTYDFAFNSRSRPQDYVINDDLAFDGWYSAEIKRIENEQSANAIAGDNRLVDAQEVFIPTDKEGAKEVFEMNDPESKARIKERMKLVQEKKLVREIEMPDTKRNIQMQLNQMAMKKG